MAGSNYIMDHVHYSKENSIKINAFFFLANNAHDYLHKSNLSSSQSMESTIMLV